MTNQTQAKRGRKPKAAVETQELAKVEIVEGVKVVTDLEPVSQAPVSDSVDPIGEDLGDVTNHSPETPVIASGEASETFEQPKALDNSKTTDVTELPTGIYSPDLGDELDKSIQDEIDSEAVADIIAHDNFTPILVPTMVGDERKGHIPCPKAVFELVQIEGWQDSIEEHPAHVQAGLKSVLYWQVINGDVKVRCQSSSRFAVAK